MVFTVDVREGGERGEDLRAGEANIGRRSLDAGITLGKEEGKRRKEKRR